VNVVGRRDLLIIEKSALILNVTDAERRRQGIMAQCLHQNSWVQILVGTHRLHILSKLVYPHTFIVLYINTNGVSIENKHNFSVKFLILRSNIGLTYSCVSVFSLLKHS